MTEIKIGDRVRYTGDSFTSLTGKMATVIAPMGACDTLVAFDHDRSQEFTLMNANLLVVGVADTRDSGAAAHIEANRVSPDRGLPFDVTVYELFDEASALLLRKHGDYGPKNISQAPGGAMNGLRVRMHDKTARLNHLINKQTLVDGDSPDPTPHYESIEDTLLDLANYALIGVLVLRGQWPDE